MMDPLLRLVSQLRPACARQAALVAALTRQAQAQALLHVPGVPQAVGEPAAPAASAAAAMPALPMHPALLKASQEIADCIDILVKHLGTLDAYAAATPTLDDTLPPASQPRASQSAAKKAEKKAAEKQAKKQRHGQFEHKCALWTEEQTLNVLMYACYALRYTITWDQEPVSAVGENNRLVLWLGTAAHRRRAAWGGCWMMLLERVVEHGRAGGEQARLLLKEVGGGPGHSSWH